MVMWAKKALTNAIWHLRKTLVDKPTQQEYIETIRKTGYRLLYQPHYQELESQLAESLLIKQWYAKWPIKWLSAIAFMGVFILIGLFVGLFSRPSVAPTYGDPELLTQYPGRELFPAMSEDGRYLLFSWRKMDRDTDLYLKDLSQPSVPPKNITNSEFVESRPIWSSDNQTIYYYRKKQKCQIIAQHLETDDVTVIGHCAASGGGALALFKDDTRLLYIGKTETDDANAIYQLDLTTQHREKLTCVTSCHFDEEYVTLSPDELSMIVVRSLSTGQHQLVLHTFSTQQEQVFINLDAYHSGRFVASKFSKVGVCLT